MMQPFPPLEPSNRSREFMYYSDQQRASMVYLWLFSKYTFRDLDSICLGIDGKASHGYQAMGVVHFLGLVDAHHHFFQGFELEDALTYLLPLTKDNPQMMLIYCYLRDYGIDNQQINKTKSENGFEYNTGSLQAFYWTEKVLLKQANDNERINKRLLLMQTKTDASNHELRIGKSTYLYSSTTLKENLKYLYDYTCTICGSRIYHIGWNSSMTRKNQWHYLSADVHHIRPLSKGGPDSFENMICLCPNCHRKFHTGEFELKEKGKSLLCMDQVLGNASELHPNHVIHLL